MYFDYAHFHPACAGRQLLVSGGRIYLACTDCGVVAELEGVSRKVSAGSAFTVGNSYKFEQTAKLADNGKPIPYRTIIGQLSEGVQ